MRRGAENKFRELRHSSNYTNSQQMDSEVLLVVLTAINQGQGQVCVPFVAYAGYEEAPYPSASCAFELRFDVFQIVRRLLGFVSHPSGGYGWL